MVFEYSLSYRDLVEMMGERGLDIAHTSIMRWVHEYGPELDKRIRPHLKPTTDSWRVDETYIKVRGQWKYLYRAVDSEGATIDFILSANRSVRAAKRFFRMALASEHAAFEQLSNESLLKQETVIRRTKYLNNIVSNS